MAEWNLNQVVTSPTATTQPTGNGWNVGESVTVPSGTTQQPNQQWEVAAQQWNVGQPAAATQGSGEEPQWGITASTPVQPSQPKLVQSVAPEVESSPPTQQWSTDQQLSQTAITSSQKDAVEVASNQKTTQPAVDDQVNETVLSESTEASPGETDAAQTSVAGPIPEAQLVTAHKDPAAHQPAAPAAHQVALQPELSKSAASVSMPPVAPKPTVAEPSAQKQAVQPPQTTTVKSAAPEQPAPPSTAMVSGISKEVSSFKPMVKSPVPLPATVTQQPLSSVVSHSVGPKEAQDVTPDAQPTVSQTTAAKTTMQVSMQPRVTQQSVTQVSTPENVTRDTPQPATKPKAHQPLPPQPTVKPEPHGHNHEDYVLKREGGNDIPLEEKQKGVYWLGPDLEGWVDKTKALKEEFRRQGDANEMFFVKNLQQLDLKSLNISDDASKFIYRVLDLKGVDVVNVIRCVLNEYHHSETGPFFFQFGEDKKFKLELLPTATQPGNGLIKSVGRRKYYAYPDICSMLKTAGVTSKGLGIMLQKLNTSGLKPALHNQISPMNELHFMLLYEISRRLVRGPHGFSLSTEPEIDQLPVGVAVARMITMFCRGNYCLNYEAVFGVQDKYNPFIDNSVVLRRQKIYALNKLFQDAEIRSQASDNPYIAKFLKYHNGYIIKTTKGFMDELDMAFRGF